MTVAEIERLAALDKIEQRVASLRLEDVTDLGKIFKATRSARGLTYRAAADEMGLNYTTLIDIEKGKNIPSFPTAQAIWKWVSKTQHQWVPWEGHCRCGWKPEGDSSIEVWTAHLEGS